ncbi:unnamed protein product [Cylindrotheca closterium]|uniref:Uncharacterized protein n=1 Tax=Cylindrotheca closterium TaxID=2856 RepID=A0AAD2CRE6_9STRA|nr:unnamed protein product [Cylindrotheca closterium]
MKTTPMMALLTIGVSSAFNASIQRKTTSHFQRNAMKNDENGHDVVPVTSAFRDIDIDIDRVKECTEHFGKCSVKEMRQLKNDLHDKRIQNVVFGESGAPEAIFEEKIFEDELDLQLSLLENEVPKSYLFPEVEEEMDDLPHLKDGTVAASLKKSVEKEKNILLFEELAEEGVLESLAICGFLGLVAFAPQVIFH